MDKNTRKKLSRSPDEKSSRNPGLRSWCLSRLVILLVLAFSTSALSATLPANAYKYQRYLIREARFEYGMEAPIPMFAGQIHQESAWRPDVSSPYADGLTQFTPSTATWIAELYPELGPADVFNPQWAIRALLKYDKKLYGNFSSVTDDCDRWAFVLASYNGGLGWIRKEQKLAATDGKDRNRWWDNVELYNARADWAYEENRDYPQRIIHTRQHYYIDDGLNWPGEKVCVKKSEPVVTPKIEEITVIEERDTPTEIPETSDPITDESPTEEVVITETELSTSKTWIERIKEWWNSWKIST